jgi:glycosyltransferase involved in cell wall biosynthesis
MAATPDGCLWVRNRNRAYAFWRTYLSAYDSVLLLVRAQTVEQPPPDWYLATGPSVQGLALPDIHSPFDWIRKRGQVRSVVNQALSETEAVHLHGPDVIPQLVWPHLRQRPYAMEVVGDPWDALAPGAVRSRLRPVYRRLFTRALRRQCHGAVGAAYVTSRFLQQRYPCPAGEFGISDVQVPAEWFGVEPRTGLREPCTLRVLTICELAQPHKCVDALISAVAACRNSNHDVRLTIAGEGRLRAELEQQARDLGVAASVCFLGHVSSPDEMRAQLDAADLFALPSRQEGLPRALVEAMTRGLPCLASPAGGIPELLPPDAILPAGDSAALANRFRAVLQSPDWLAAASQRNVECARSYSQAVLDEKRRQFFDHVARETRATRKGGL